MTNNHLKSLGDSKNLLKPLGLFHLSRPPPCGRMCSPSTKMSSKEICQYRLTWRGPRTAAFFQTMTAMKFIVRW